MELTEEVRARRVAVAEDVLVQLGRRDVPLRVYPAAGYIHGYMFADVDLGDDLRDYADTVQVNCVVCAIGALLLSKARLLDEVPMADILGSPKVSLGANNVYVGLINVGHADICRLLEDTFDGDTLDRVEAFFEGNSMGMDAEDYYFRGISAYAQSLPSSRDRMVEIAENIVRNRGEFIVPAEHVRAGVDLRNIR